METEYVLIMAAVVRREGKVVTVKLVDGFGNAECVVHKDQARSGTVDSLAGVVVESACVQVAILFSSIPDVDLEKAATQRLVESVEAYKKAHAAQA